MHRYHAQIVVIPPVERVLHLQIDPRDFMRYYYIYIIFREYNIYGIHYNEIIANSQLKYTATDGDNNRMEMANHAAIAAGGGSSTPRRSWDSHATPCSSSASSGWSNFSGQQLIVVRLRRGTAIRVPRSTGSQRQRCLCVRPHGRMQPSRVRDGSGTDRSERRRRATATRQPSTAAHPTAGDDQSSGGLRRPPPRGDPLRAVAGALQLHGLSVSGQETQGLESLDCAGITLP